MEILGFLVFLFVSHFGLMQIFRLTTYHAFFLRALPLLIVYSALVAWALHSLEMSAFFVWQIILASFWLFLISRKQTKNAEGILAASSDRPEDIRLLALSISKTKSCFTASSIIYIVVFIFVYIWFYNK